MSHTSATASVDCRAKPAIPLSSLHPSAGYRAAWHYTAISLFALLTVYWQNNVIVVKDMTVQYRFQQNQITSYL